VRLAPARLTADLGIVAVGVLSLLGALSGDGVLYPADVLFTTAWVAALLLRHRRWWLPVAVPLILVVQTIALARWPNDSPLTMLALYLAAWLFGYGSGFARGSGWRAVVGGTLAWPLFLVVAVVLSDGYGDSGWADVFYPSLYVVVLVGLTAFVGRTARTRGEARTRAERARRALDDQRDELVAAERARIGQDLRALVTAELVAVRDAAARGRHALAVDDRAAAEAALLDVEEGGRRTLTELRQVLGLLRRDTSDASLAPQPGVGTLAQLVRRAEVDGTQVSLHLPAAVEPLLAPGIELAVYRVVERALTAASGDVEVRLRRQGDDLLVRVETPGLNHLLREDRLAVRERVRLYGGDLLLGTDADDHDVLEVRFPLPAAAPPEVPA
jgi:signal transduction histidine kinase